MGRPFPFAILAVGTLVVPSAAQDWSGHARVDGHVTDAQGAPLAGATVSLERPSGEKGPRVTSNAAGEWVVDGIAAGSWRIVVSAPGFRTAHLGVHLPGESSWVAPPEVRLDREPPPTLEPPVPDESSDEATPAAWGDGPSPGEAADIRAALAEGRVARAGDLVADLSRDDPTAVPLLVEVGAALLAAGSTAEAVACLDRALEAAPGHLEARYRRALGLLALGRRAEARHDFETLLELEPDGPHAAKARLALDELSGVPE
jgi:hypothetical protein